LIKYIIRTKIELKYVFEEVGKLSNQINGILMMVLGVILAILYFALPTFLVYTYWLAVIIIVGYGFYTYQKRG
jgi:hypothetical protein